MFFHGVSGLICLVSLGGEGVVLSLDGKRQLVGHLQPVLGKQLVRVAQLHLGLGHFLSDFGGLLKRSSEVHCLRICGY